MALAVAVAAAGLAQSTPTAAQVEPQTAPTTTTVPAPERVVDVRIGDNFFRRKKIRVRPGTTVRWRNAGRNEHNVLPNRTFSRGADRFGVDDIPRGETYSYRFDEPGRYGYYCSFHGAPRTGQFGTVVVKAPKDAKRSRDASSTDE